MNAILEGQCQRMPFYTDLRAVFKALGGRQNDFNWLITDLEFLNLDGVELPPEMTLKYRKTAYEFPDTVWLSGKRLSEIIESYNFQFVWAVFSGVDPRIEIDPSKLEVRPIADGNSAVWQAEIGIQHPRASIEIVCWDSTLTLFRSEDEDLIRRFCEFFPEAQDLDAFILKSTNK